MNDTTTSTTIGIDCSHLSAGAECDPNQGSLSAVIINGILLVAFFVALIWLIADIIRALKHKQLQYLKWPMLLLLVTVLLFIFVKILSTGVL